MTFADLKLHDALLAALNEAGYTEPSPIQAQAIPVALEGRDIMASAQTGTGKTAAFLLPGLHRMTMTPGGKGKGPRILVLTPTRELARQVETAARNYGARLKIRTASILGGMNYQQQQRLLQRPVDVMVATPGRLLDLMDRGQIKLDRVEMLVLDEADRMLDLGFIEDVELIASRAPAERQTLLFSATLEDRIAKLAENVMNNPERIAVTHQQAKHENITQGLYFCDDIEHKKAILMKLLADTAVNQSVVFTATRIDAENLSQELAGFGIQTAALHGDMKQPARNRTLRALKDGQVRCLVATDVAARGIDVVGITHVFNFDLPMVLEDYVHRIGRTGRAGRDGTAISLVNRRDRGKLQRLAAYTGNAIPELIMPGLEPRPAPKRREGGFRDGGPRREGGFREGGHRDNGPRREGGHFERRRDDQPRREFDGAPRAPRGEPRPDQQRRPGGYARSGDRFSVVEGRDSGPREQKPWAARNDQPRRERPAEGRRFDGNDENIGNRAGVATHERSAFDRNALRGERPAYGRGGKPGGARTTSFDARGNGGGRFPDSRSWEEGASRPSYRDDRVNADRPQPQVRVIRSRYSREGAASTEGFDGTR